MAGPAPAPSATAPPPDASTAGAVLDELQGRYHKWRLRNLNYSRLLAFLSFVTLLLVVLFLQRSSHTSYQVHSTLVESLLPEDAIDSVDDVYAWLSDLLTSVWRDPVCGDGVCESPFEYAAYGRFGCRADCGRLQDIQNLTAIQIDLLFDFSHPTGSVPATELMGQASWNLCPAGGSSAALLQSRSRGCYWTEDQTFEQLSGSTTVIVPDVPEGKWALVLKRDIFNKVSGGVRILPLMEQQALAAKVAAALAAAAAQRDSEGLALGQALELGSQGALQLVNATLAQAHAAELVAAEGRFQSGALDAAGYLDELAALQQQLEGDLLELQAAEAGCPDLPFYQPGMRAGRRQFGPAADPTLCGRFANLTQQARQEQLAGMVDVITNRLAVAGAAAGAALAAELVRLQQAAPELHAVVRASRGTVASQPASAAPTTLAQFYEDPWAAPAPAKAALAGSAVRAAGVTPAVLMARAEARIEELGAAEGAVLALPEVQLALNLTGPGSELPYTYVAWQGGPRAYETCNLESRVPQYAGACTPRVPCSNSSVAGAGAGGSMHIVYSCAPSSLPSASDACGDICDAQNICSALCECGDACDADQVCQCDTCLKVGSARDDPDFLAMLRSAGLSGNAIAAAALGALLDGEGQEQEQGWGEAGAGEDGQGVEDFSRAAEAEPLPVLEQGDIASSYSSSGGHRRQRHLLQTSDAMLQAVLGAVGTLQSSQAALQQEVQALQAAVADASLAAQDKAVQTLIAAGQQQIVSGQGAIQALLSDILGKQSAASAAAAAQLRVLANLQNLQQQQLVAQAQLEQSAKDQTGAIAAALQQGILTPSQALELYRRIRLQTLAASKAALLASVPCTTSALRPHSFDVDQSSDPVVDTARLRYIGTSNRVIAGLLLFNQRGLPSPCTNSRFGAIGGSCKKGLDTAPYGVDPVFKLGTRLYNPDLDALQAYNCSLLERQTYNLTEEVSVAAEAAARVTNRPPYCAELFSPRSLPYGFHSAELRQYGEGFPVLFDINLDAGSALNWLAFIQEGLFLDSRTQLLLAQVVTYNPELRLFSSAVVTFEFAKGGSVEVTHQIQTLRVELYATPLDAFRLVLEVALTLCIAALACGELRGMWRVARLTGNPLSYFASGWQAMDFASTCLLVACAAMWWVLVWRHALPFAIDLRFNVYADLGADAAFLSLADDGAGLQDMHAAFGRLQSLSDKLAWYAALTGINLLMLIARMLQLMDFQPRLGVVTRSLAHAGPDLLHFGLVFGLVFIGYAMLAHLIFGNSIAGFSTFGGSVNTCFALLLGETEVNADLRSLSGLQAVAGAAFFWTYEPLVFLVLLNFLLAIIVDAFSQVKERTTDTTGIHTEVGQMLLHAYHSATSRFSRDRISDVELSKLLRWWQDSERSSTAAATATVPGGLHGDGDVSGDGLAEARRLDRGRPKLLRVQGRLVAEEELRCILQAYIVEEQQDGDIEAAGTKPGSEGRPLGSLRGRLLGSLAPGRGASPSQKALRPPPPDLDKVAHYVMLRFGEEDDRASSQQEGTERESGDGSRRRRSGNSQQQPQQPQKQAHQQQPEHQPGPNFRIAAHHGSGGGSQPTGDAPATSVLSTAALFGSSGEASNGRRLAHAMLTEVEQGGAEEAAAALLQVQGTLAAAQQRLLDSQERLSSQQAAVLAALSAAAAGSISAAASRGDGAAGAGWGVLATARQPISSFTSPSVSFRQRTVQRTESGRTVASAAALPPGRPAAAAGAALGSVPRRLSGTSEEEHRP